MPANASGREHPHSAEAEDLYRAIDSVRVGVQIIGFDWKYLYLNDTAASHGQRTKGELLGHTMMEMYPGIESTGMFQSLRRCMDRRVPDTLENEFTYPDGRKRWFELGIHPVSLGILIFSTDITDRKLNEEHLRRQAALLDIVPDAIIVEDLDGYIQFWNKGAEVTYGWSSGEALGNNVRDLLYAHDRDLFDVTRENDFKETQWRGELKHARKDGKEIRVESRRVLVRNEQGNPYAVLIVNTDITQRRSLESQLLRIQRMESIGTLAGGVAHDLNNVLGPILLALDILHQKIDDKNLHAIIETIHASAQRGAELVRQVLAFARGVEGERAPVQIGTLIREIGSLVKETFPKDIFLDIVVQEDLPPLWADATQLHQVLMNLCVNARDAMTRGGRLEIRAEHVMIDEQYAKMNLEARPGSYVVASVTDNGTGMPPAIVERIFEPFFTTKDLHKGTGLGLATVRAIVKSHNGFVNVYSEVGKGTTFRVYLPASTKTRTEQKTAEEHVLLPGNGELILVVDDEEGIRQITKTTLEAYNYRVITAADGTEALARFAKRKDDVALAVIDVMMPYLDGFSATRALRKINPHLKVILVSGLDANGGNANIPENVRFLKKPYTSETLVQLISEVLRNP